MTTTNNNSENKKTYIIIYPNGQTQVLTEKEFNDLQASKSIKLVLLENNIYTVKMLLKG